MKHTLSLCEHGIVWFHKWWRCNKDPSSSVLVLNHNSKLHFHVHYNNLCKPRDVAAERQLNHTLLYGRVVHIWCEVDISFYTLRTII